MNGGSSRDEPRRGGVRGRYDPDPRRQPSGPGEGGEPDADGAAGPDSADLSDLWREPDPWAADERRGLDAWQDGDQPRHSDRPEYGDRRGYGAQPGYADQPGSSYGRRENGGGRDGRDDDPRRTRPTGPARPGASRGEQPYQSPVTWSGQDQGPDQARREPDGPTEVQRDPRGWYEPAEPPRDWGVSPRTGSQPRPAGGQDAWRQAPPPAGPRGVPRLRRPGPRNRARVSGPGGMTPSGLPRRLSSGGRDQAGQAGPSRPGKPSARPGPRRPGGRRPRVTVSRPVT